MIILFLRNYVLLFFVIPFSINLYGGTTPFITTWKVDNELNYLEVIGNNNITIPTIGDGYSYMVDWGDGTPPTFETANATHTYDNIGIYTISITGDFPRIYFNNTGDVDRILTIEQWGDNVWESMESAFKGCFNLQGNFTDIPDLSNVNSMSDIFAGASNFNYNIGNWDVGNVTNMSNMFSNAESFNQDIGNWNVGSVINMSNMFSNALSFNQDISNWDVSSVTNMSWMFYNSRLFNQDISNWDISNVIDISNMFFLAESFNQDIGSWDLSSVANMSGMFRLTKFNQDISEWDVSNVRNMSGMFYVNSSFNQDISEWDVSNVIDMENMFSHAQSFNQDIGSWDVSRVNNMKSMFYKALVFNQDIGNWDVNRVTNMELMFVDAILFDQDLGNWNVENVTNMEQMFIGSKLSITNYDSLLIGWSKLSLQPNISFSAGLSQYCQGVEAKENIISTYNWTITDAGTAAPIIDDIDDQNISENYTFPTITGVGLSGNEKYYTGANGTGLIYNAGDVINFNDFPSYPVTIYIYDRFNAICTAEQDFELIISRIPTCTSLSTPISESINVRVDTDLIWNVVMGAEGYKLSVRTSFGGTYIINDIDVGKTLSYNLPNNLPEKTNIFVTITPYNFAGSPLGCTEESFFTEVIPKPPKFFTPNNDSINDNWIVPDPSNAILNISIYNRYGKLLKKITDVNKGWDGTFQNKTLPTNDYWYIIKYKNGEMLNGHFSLVR